MRGYGFVLVATVIMATANVARAEPDRKPPELKHTPVASVAEGELVVITVDIKDESGIFAPMVWYRVPGTDMYSSVDLIQKGDRTYRASIPARGKIEYWVEAYDEFGNGPSRAGTPEKPFLVTIATSTEAANSLIAVAPEATPTGTPAVEAKPTEAKLEAGPGAGTLVAAPTETSPAPTVSAAAEVKPAAAETLANVDLKPVAKATQAPEAKPSLPPAVVEPADEGPIAAGPAPKAGTPIYKQWWFIGGAGVVAVGAVGGLIYALLPNTVEQNVFTATMRRP